MSALTSEQTRVRRRDHANFAPKSREKIAKFPEFRRTARTKFACSRPTYVEQIAEPRCSSSPSRQCVEVTRRDHANLPQKSVRKNCKVPGISACRAQRNCLKSASMRCVNQRAPLQLFTESDVRPDAKKVRVWRRCHAIFAPKSREEIAKFPEIRRAARTKTACIRPAKAAHAQ